MIEAQVREDGRCLTCLGPRGNTPKTLVKRTLRDLKLQLSVDPFCSTECARVFYGTSLSVPAPGPRSKPVGTREKARA